MDKNISPDGEAEQGLPIALKLYFPLQQPIFGLAPIITMPHCGYLGCATFDSVDVFVFKSKCDLIMGSDTHNYDPLSRGNCQTGWLRTVVDERLLSQASGVHFINKFRSARPISKLPKLPRNLKLVIKTALFPKYYFFSLLQNFCLCTDEFMALNGNPWLAGWQWTRVRQFGAIEN